MVSEERALNLSSSSSGYHRTPDLDRNSPLSSNTKIFTELNGHLKSDDEEAGGVATEDVVDDEGLSPKEAEGFSFFRLPSRKKWIFLLLAFANFAACTCFSLLAPFFPAEVSK